MTRLPSSNTWKKLTARWCCPVRKKSRASSIARRSVAAAYARMFLRYRLMGLGTFVMEARGYTCLVGCLYMHHTISVDAGLPHQT